MPDLAVVIAGGAMGGRSFLDERRRHQRFQVTDPAFVFGSFTVGKIVDISMSGLAFTYDGQDLWPREAAAIDLLIDDEVFLKEVPIRVVSDIIIAEEPRYQLVTRQCGVQFGGLTPYQVHQLEDYIRIHIQESQIPPASKGIMESLGYD